VTALTAQNPRGVIDVLPVHPEFVGGQIDAVAQDFGIGATKTGMLAERGVVEMVAAKVREHGLQPLVIDPVLVATTGRRLLDHDGLSALVSQLLPLATVVTPNIDEAEALTGRSARTPTAIRDVARHLHALGPGAVVVKGGHARDADAAIDVLFDGHGFREFSGPRYAVQAVHGTGCAFSAAIAACLARGDDLPTAVAGAKSVVAAGIRRAIVAGDGSYLVNTVSRAADS